jgi:lysine 2,3-aminomutase
MEAQLLPQDDSEPPGTMFVQPTKGKKTDRQKTTTYFPGTERRSTLYSEIVNGRLNLTAKPLQTSSLNIKDFREKHYPLATDAEWNNWRWQLRNRIRKFDDLARMVDVTPDEYGADAFNTCTLPLAITPYYTALLSQAANPDQALRKAVIPLTDEYLRSPGEEEDPLGEDSDSPVPGLVHRYPDRVLFLVTDFCSVNCRYCTRSRILRPNEKYPFNMGQWERAIEYIRNHTEVRDVLLSGGDPLTLADEKLEWLLTNLRAIPHVEIIRIGTKVPMVLPMRVTKALCRLLKNHHPLWMSLHCTHPDELTPEAAEACARLADAGIPLGSQTVLLAGINDSVDVMRRLMHGLLKIRVRPYYLYQCDPIQGSRHFRTPVSKGLEIIRGLRGFTSGYAIPHFVIDAPHGGGKIPLLPDYVEGHDETGNLVLKNYQGCLYKYPENRV